MAMLHRMLAAFLAAGVTEVGAQAAEGRGHLAVARYEAGGHPAQLGAIDIERDTARHHLRGIFVQAGAGTAVAGIGAGVARVDARLVSGVHRVLLHHL